MPARTHARTHDSMKHAARCNARCSTHYHTDAQTHRHTDAQTQTHGAARRTDSTQVKPVEERAELRVEPLHAHQSIADCRPPSGQPHRPLPSALSRPWTLSASKAVSDHAASHSPPGPPDRTVSHTHARARTHARTRSRTCTHIHARTNTHARTHAYTHTHAQAAASRARSRQVAQPNLTGGRSPSGDVAGVGPVPAQMRAGVSPVPVQMWQGWAQS